MHQYLAFAGLYDTWTTPDGEDLYYLHDHYARGGSLHGTAAQPDARRVTRGIWRASRSMPQITSAKEVLSILERSAGVTLDAYPVSRLVNKPSHESPALIQRVQ